MHPIGDHIHLVLVAFLAAQGGRQIGRAVIGVLAGDDVFLGGPVQHVIEELDEPDRRIVGLRAGGREEDVVEVARRQLGQLGRQIGRRWGAEIGERRIIGHGADLLGHGVGDLVAAIADLHAPHAAGAVDELVAVGIIDVDAVRLGDDHGAFLAAGFERLPRVQDVAAVLVPQVFRIVGEVFSHRAIDFLFIGLVGQPTLPNPAEQDGEFPDRKHAAETVR